MNERLKKQIDFILEADKEKEIFRQTHISPTIFQPSILLDTEILLNLTEIHRIKKTCLQREF